MLEPTAIGGGYAVDYGTADVTPRAVRTGVPARVVAPRPTLDQIKRAQDALLAIPEGERWCGDPEHHFADGMYMRVLSIPAAHYVIGKMHRHEHLVMLVSGECEISTADGMTRMRGPHVWLSTPGEKRILATVTDCVFQTVHLNPANTRDLAELEAAHIVPEADIDYGAPLLADQIQRIYA